MKSKKIMLSIVFFIGISMFLYPIISKAFFAAEMNRMVADFNKLAETSRNMIEKEQVKLTDKFPEGIIATIEIPKLDLNLPIYYGDSESILAKGIGLIKQKDATIGGINTHRVLAGHSGFASKELFTNIHELSNGDIFKLTTLDGVLEYKVIDKRKIRDTEADYLNVQKGKDLVTLLTCPAFNSDHYRIIVTGERVSHD